YYVFQAEDGIRDATVTGVQTCALPISFQILADQPLGQALGSQPTLSRWENAPSAREIVFLHDALLDWFVQVCGQQVRRRGEILRSEERRVGKECGAGVAWCSETDKGRM